MTERSFSEVHAELLAPGSPFEIDEIDVRGVRTRVWRHAIPTLRGLVEGMPGYGARAFLVYEDERLTYAETYARIAALASYLQETCGVVAGERVAIAMRNYPEWPIAFYATVSIGGIAVPINAWWKGDEMEYGLRDSGACVLVCDAERARLLESHAARLDLRRVLVARPSGATAPGHVDLASVIGAAAPDGKLPHAHVDPDDDATIFYTSGTTGSPKGALGTHRNLLTNVTNARFGQARALRRRGLPLPPPEAAARTLLVSVPFFHVTGCHSLLATSTATGSTIVTMYRWNPERALELIEREGVNQVGGVPSMVWQVIESPDFAKRDTRSVTTVSYGGAPASPELVRRIAQAFPTATPSNGYGMTETSALAIVNNGIDYVRKPESVGLPVAVVEVKVIDAEGQTLPPGEVGELCMRGPNVLRSYWRKPEASAQTFRDGWVHSGDIARIDDEGFVFIVDRAKDMLIRGGENVYCVEVEDALYSHPAVMDAAVVGIPHPVLGEEVGAVVQVVAGARVSAEDLRAHVGERLAGFKVPVHVELRSEPLPRNANGKILKVELREALRPRSR